jgi:hypothetical protein
MVYTSRPREAGRQGTKTKKKEIRAGHGYFDVWRHYLIARETILKTLILKAL